MPPKPPPAVELYRPLPQAEDFHNSTAKWRIVVGSNRSGKTLCAAVELARAVLGADPYGKYRQSYGTAFIIGLDTEHLGMLWRKLYLPGAFKVIYDSIEEKWRPLRWIGETYVEIDPRDLDMRSLWQDAPPLIPHDAIDRCSWIDKSRYIPRTVSLVNGWRIVFVSSRGLVKQGEHYDFVWIDEQISNPQFFYEAARGLCDIDPSQKAYGVWTATGQKQNPILWELVEQSKEDSEIKVFIHSINGNPFVTKEERERFSKMLPDIERRVRIEGRFAIESWLIYPEFNRDDHVTTEINIPQSWTRYMVLDPGSTCCATLFAAVDPYENIYVYRELTQHNSSAVSWASAIRAFPDINDMEAWIIDTRAGRSRTIGADVTVAMQYFAAASQFDIRPRVIGSMNGFIPACDNPDVRREILKQYLINTSRKNPPCLKILTSCTQLIRQLRLAQFSQKSPGKRITGEFDLLDTLEYLVAYKPRHVSPTASAPASRPHNILEVIHERNRMFRKSSHGSTVIRFG